MDKNLIPVPYCVHGWPFKCAVSTQICTSWRTVWEGINAEHLRLFTVEANINTEHCSLKLSLFVHVLIDAWVSVGITLSSAVNWFIIIIKKNNLFFFSQKKSINIFSYLVYKYKDRSFIYQCIYCCTSKKGESNKIVHMDTVENRVVDTIPNIFVINKQEILRQQPSIVTSGAWEVISLKVALS